MAKKLKPTPILPIPFGNRRHQEQVALLATILYASSKFPTIEECIQEALSIIRATKS